jgi:non-ribosomal peptide synthetase component F
LTGQIDFLVGSPVANRPWPETEPLIGFFVNTVLFRCRLSGDPTFRTILRRSRDTAIACYGHQELPFERLVQALRPKRRSDRNALFQVNLRVQGPAPDPPSLDGLTSSRVPGGWEASRFDLALGFVDAPGALNGYVEYCSALFTEASVARWLEGFSELAKLAARDPDIRLSQLAEPVTRALIGR